MTSSKLETVKINRLNDDPYIYVARRCEFTRIIVSLTRNNNMWLTSLGWRPEEKSIALGCDNTPKGLAIQIPKKYAKEIKPDDIISISCQELGFQGQMQWGGSAPNVAPVESTDETFSKSTTSPVVSDLSAKSLKSGGSKKYLIGGIAALAIFAVIGTVLISGKNTPKDDIQKTAKIDTPKKQQNPNNSSVITDDAKALIDMKRKAAEAVAAEIEAKKNEVDFLAAKKIEDEKAAIAAAKNAELEKVKTEQAKKAAAAKAKIEKAQQAEKAKADKLAAEKAKIGNVQQAENAKKRKEETQKQIVKTSKDASTPIEPTISPTALTSAEIKEMQDGLSDMGYYAGPIDGTLSESTRSAVSFFRSIFDTLESTETDIFFLAEVKKQRGIYIKNRAETNQPTPTVERPLSEDIAPVIQDVPPTNVATLPAQPLINVPKTQTAPPLTIDEVTPEVENITPAKVVKQKPLIYPTRPNNRKKFTQTVIVIVSYGIDTSGKPVDVEIFSNDYEGVYTNDFNKAAVNFTRSQIFEPARRGNTPVPTEDLKITIGFKK